MALTETSAHSGQRALLITGTVGVGKTSVAEAVGDLLSEAQMPNAVVDIDWLRRAWPAPSGDRFNMAIAMRNLRSVSANYFDAGIVRLVLAGVLETQADRDHHEASVGVPMVVCRLRVDLLLVRVRLARRHENLSASLRWHLDRSGELDAIMDAAAVEDCQVDATTATLAEAAAAVIREVGWTEPRAPS
ncbi:MAG: ATP-binding protein [Nocardioidaceae bacterium]|nr:ATP-binding protein [Nocardioidaceae bacterium]